MEHWRAFNTGKLTVSKVKPYTGASLHLCSGDSGSDKVVFECNYLCACAQSIECPQAAGTALSGEYSMGAGAAEARRMQPRQCGFRWAQRGVTKQLVVKKTENKGWGLFTMSAIQKGDHVCTYIGEYVSGNEYRDKELAYQKEGWLTSSGKRVEGLGSYGFAADDGVGNKKGGIMIDATKYRNVSAFCNHSCDRHECNLLVKRVFTNHLGPKKSRMPRIVFYAKWYIHPGEELLVNYTEKPDGCTCSKCNARAREHDRCGASSSKPADV